jgi:hypothetical protein
MSNKEQGNLHSRLAFSVNSLEEGIGPDQADLLDRVIDKGVHLDPIDQIAIITGTSGKFHPSVVDEQPKE